MAGRGVRDDRLTGAAVTGALVAITVLVMSAVEVFTAEWRTAPVELMSVALWPTGLIVAVLLVVAARRSPATACVLVAVALVLVFGVVLGAFAYEEWMETQPGGRGYVP